MPLKMDEAMTMTSMLSPCSGCVGHCTVLVIIIVSSKTFPSFCLDLYNLCKCITLGQKH